MLRVSDVWERALHGPDLAVAEAIVIRSGRYARRRGLGLAGVSGRPAGFRAPGFRAPGLRALCLHLVTIPPGTRGVPRVHEDHESAIFSVSGETEVWYGEGLRHRTVVKAGDFMYVPPGTPHMPVNRGDLMTVAVVACTDPEEQDGV